MDDIHVLPINDVREHEESRSCWCEPDLQYPDEGDSIIVVHHAEDGRELVEEHGLN